MNRGRIQAQGKGCEQSQSWTQEIVPTKSDGRERADLLKMQLTRRELKDREYSFGKLDKFISNAPYSGYDVCTRSFTPIPPQEDVRVDVEIIKGKAFRD